MKNRIKNIIAILLPALAIQSALAEIPEKLYMQFTYGLVMTDDYINISELTYNGPSIFQTSGFANEYSFTYDDRGISTTALVQQNDPYKWYVRGALILNSKTYVNYLAQSVPCSSWSHFHENACPNVVGWFNNFVMPLNVGETVILAPLSAIPEPSSIYFALLGLPLIAAGANHRSSRTVNKRGIRKSSDSPLQI